jgi:hypothetical protein
MYCNFHFVLTRELKNRIKILSKILNKNMSETVNYIINKVDPMINELFKKSKKKSRWGYHYIKADAKMNIYIETTNYRKIRQLHNNCYSFSMAMILRGIIEFFLDKTQSSQIGLISFLLEFNKGYRKYIEELLQKLKWKDENKEPSNIDMLIRITRIFYYSEDFEFINIKQLI